MSRRWHSTGQWWNVRQRCPETIIFPHPDILKIGSPIERLRLKDGQEKYPPARSYHGACVYAKIHWARIRLYIEYGLLEIDYNLVEDKMRPLVLGRKIGLFTGSEIT